MLTTKAPIGEIINYIHKNPNSYGDQAFFKKVEDLYDLITIRTNKHGINDSLESLLGYTFELKIEILKNPALVDKTFKGLNKGIEDRIEKQFNESTKYKYKALELAFVSALNIYKQIANSIIKNAPEEIMMDVKNLSSVHYDEYIAILKGLPGIESQFNIALVNSSLTFDYALIVSELVFSNELKLKKSEIETLCSLLKNSIEDIAIYSNAFRLWTPSDSDETQWMRNIKIRISAFESKHFPNTVLSVDLDRILAA